MTLDEVSEEESPLSRAFAKDRSEEDFLQELNNHLEGFGEWDPDPETTAEPFPCFIIGTPRSGTTLLNQLLAHCLHVGYIDNLAAAFWKAPVVGIRLSKKLLARDPAGSFESAYGRTRGVAEPHEFGYFWRDLLGKAFTNEGTPVSDDTWARVRRYMLLFGQEFGGAFALKTFWAGWHARTLPALLPKAHFFFVERDLVDTAISILLAREAYAGGREAWIGPRPKGLGALDPRSPAEEVAAQLLLLRAAHDRFEADPGSESGDAPSRVYRVSYDRLCSDPAAVLKEVADRLGSAGARVAEKHPPPSLQPRDPLQTEGPGGGPTPNADEILNEVRAALESVKARLDAGASS